MMSLLRRPPTRQESFVKKDESQLGMARVRKLPGFADFQAPPPHYLPSPGIGGPSAAGLLEPSRNFGGLPYRPVQEGGTEIFRSRPSAARASVRAFCRRFRKFDITVALQLVIHCVIGEVERLRNRPMRNAETMQLHSPQAVVQAGLYRGIVKLFLNDPAILIA